MKEALIKENYCIYLNARQLLDNPQKNTSAKGKCIYPNLRQTLTNKTSDEKQYFTINNNQNMSHSIHLHQSVSLSLSSQSVPSSSLQSLLTSPTSALPFHNISSSISSMALDIQHLLKPFTVTFC